MALATAEAAVNQASTVRDRAVETVRQAAHVAHEARLFKALASDAVEDGVHAAKRAIARGVHDLEDLRDSATYRVRQAPLLTVGLAVGVGMLLGAVVGWFGRNAVMPKR